MKKVFTFIILLSLLLTTRVFAKNRIIAGSVAIAEILDVLQINEVVGVPDSPYEIPERYKNVSTIGSSMRPSIEAIRTLKPTLYIGSSTIRNTLELLLKENKIPYIFVELRNLDQLRETILSLGKLLGAQTKAKEIYSEFIEREKNVLEKIKNKKKPAVLLLSGSPGNLTVGTEISYVGSLVKKLGAINVIKDTSKNQVPLNMEYILQTDPDFILVYPVARPNDYKEFWSVEFEKNKLWKHFRAFKENHVIFLPPSYFGGSANIKSLDALEMLAEILFDVKIRGEK